MRTMLAHEFRNLPRFVPVLVTAGTRELVMQTCMVDRKNDEVTDSTSLALSAQAVSLIHVAAGAVRYERARSEFNSRCCGIDSCQSCAPTANTVTFEIFVAWITYSRKPLYV